MYCYHHYIGCFSGFYKFKIIGHYLILIVFISFILFSCSNNTEINLNSNPEISYDWIIPKEQVIDGGAGKDGIPSIDQPIFLNFAAIQYILDDDLVLILNDGNLTHIYPHKILDFHESINDDFIEKKIAITYCPLTGTGIGFERLIKGSNTSFGISGLVYKNNQILFDRLTQSYWSQMLRKCVYGDLQGRDAKTITLFETTWKTAKMLSPNALVLSDQTGFNRIYDQYPYLDYKTNHEFIIFPLEVKDERLNQKERVFGIIKNENNRIYQFDLFDEDISVINDFFEGQSILLVGSRNHQFITAFLKEKNKTYKAIPNEFPVVFSDENGNKYDIFGKVIEGHDIGKRLSQPEAMMGYWFAFVDFFGRPQIYQ